MRRVVCLVLFLFLAEGGCNTSKNLWQAGIPGWQTKLWVDDVDTRGDYLEVEVERQELELTSYTRNDEVCRSVLREGQPVTFVETGPRGGFLGENGETCPAVGIGSLAQWRARRDNPTKHTASPVPRAQAQFRTVYSDDDVVFLRGNFPLANLLGFVSLNDLIAVVEHDDRCRKAIEEGVASMEYRQKGPNVLALVSGNGLCPIQGLLQPQ